MSNPTVTAGRKAEHIEGQPRLAFHLADLGKIRAGPTTRFGLGCLAKIDQNPSLSARQTEKCPEVFTSTY